VSEFKIIRIKIKILSKYDDKISKILIATQPLAHTMTMWHQLLRKTKSWSNLWDMKGCDEVVKDCVASAHNDNAATIVVSKKVAMQSLR